MARYASFSYSNDFGDVFEKLHRMEHALSGEEVAEWLSQEVFPYFREKALGRFVTNGDDATGRWPALRESSQRRRGYYGYAPPGPINQRTGGLHEYIEDATPQVLIQAEGAVMQYPGNMPDDQATIEKFTTAQRGATKTHTPPRPVVAVAPEDWAFVRSRLEAHVMRGGIG